jgi:hypothetical protein
MKDFAHVLLETLKAKQPAIPLASPENLKGPGPVSNEYSMISIVLVD